MKVLSGLTKLAAGVLKKLGGVLPQGEDACLVMTDPEGLPRGLPWGRGGGGEPVQDGVTAWRGTRMLSRVEVPPDAGLHVPLMPLLTDVDFSSVRPPAPSQGRGGGEVARARRRVAPVARGRRVSVVPAYVYAGGGREAWEFYERTYGLPGKVKMRREVERELRAQPVYRFTYGKGAAG